MALIDFRKCVRLGRTAPIGLLVACGVTLAQPAAGPDVHFHGLSQRDAAFLEDLQRTQRAAVAGGKVALDRARVEAVKKYAQLVVDTHSKLLEDGNKLAKFKGLPVPRDGDRPDDRASDPLRAVPDDRFDRAFVAWVLAAQGPAYRAAKRAASEAGDPNVQALAANAASHIEKQLEIARELAQSLVAPPRKTPLGDAPRGDALVSGDGNSPPMNAGKNALIAS